MKAMSVADAVALIPDGARLMIGGFMGVGTPERVLDEIVRQRKSGLTVIANDACSTGKGIGKLVDAELVSSLVATRRCWSALPASAPTMSGPTPRPSSRFPTAFRK